ncbi:MAG: cation-translocating P-type ATPase [Verrucomicrobiales bacterium]|nr:cation-translocating P-type ATPase [Verrucomicrobiales bacterium]
MQVTSLTSRTQDCAAPAEAPSPGESSLRLQQTLVGMVFILNAALAETFFTQGALVAGLSGAIGAILLGGPIVWTSIKDLRRGQVSINELVSLAVIASFATGDYKTAGIVSFFMLIGEIIETRTAAGARASIESLIKLTPTRARRLGPAGEEEIATSDLKIGDQIRVRPGDNIAADGRVVKGSGSVNQASITGESLPVDKKVDDEVFAGTTNLNGVLEIEVTRAGEDTTLGKVRDLILSAEQTKLPIMRLMDQYMGYYTPLVLTLGALVWMFTRDLNRVISVLVVSCPCAFILATPSAMVAALSAAARLGILVKNIGDLELAARLSAFVFDKTGTLTTGCLEVSRLMPKAGVSPAELLQLAASAERYSNHPTAKAVLRLANETEIPLLEPQEFSEVAGRGIEAVVGTAKVLVGRASWLAERQVQGELANSVDVQEAEGFSLIFVSRNGESIGWIGLRDQTRPEATEALAELRAAGIQRIAMVTGDRRPVAERVGKEIRCEEISADCLPQNKVEFVRSVKAQGYRVAVIGDGVNDAPALASGDIGIAMGAAGSEVAIHSATIALMNNDLRRIPFLVRLSRSTLSVINQNFLIGMVFILGGLIMAAVGYLNPIVAAILHNAGSLLVVFNSARLVRHGEEMQAHGAPPNASSDVPPTSTVAAVPMPN